VVRVLKWKHSKEGEGSRWDIDTYPLFCSRRSVMVESVFSIEYRAQLLQSTERLFQKCVRYEV
jgi:hypothetical protein